MFYHFKIKKLCGGYMAECLEIPDCETQAEDIETLKQKMKTKLNNYIIHTSGYNSIIPLPMESIDYVNMKDCELFNVKVNQDLVFSLLLKNTRLKNHKTQREMAKILNYNHVSGYNRLEKYANPTLSTLYKILEILPDFPLYLLFSSKNQNK